MRSSKKERQANLRISVRERTGLEKHQLEENESERTEEDLD